MLGIKATCFSEHVGYIPALHAMLNTQSNDCMQEAQAREQLAKGHRLGAIAHKLWVQMTVHALQGGIKGGRSTNNKYL